MSPIPRDLVRTSPQGPAQIDPMGIVPLVQLLLMPLIPVLEVLVLEMVSRRHRVVTGGSRNGTGSYTSQTALGKNGPLSLRRTSTNIGVALELLWQQLVCHACGQRGTFGTADCQTPSLMNMPAKSPPTFSSLGDVELNTIGSRTGTWQSDVTLCEEISGPEEGATSASSGVKGRTKVTTKEARIRSPEGRRL
jgi:hypothetical protein